MDYSRIISLISYLESDASSPGEIAALRRLIMSPKSFMSFHRLAVKYLPEDYIYCAQEWKVLLSIMAMMAPRIHTKDTPFGTALSMVGFKPTYFERLLSASGDTRLQLLYKAGRWLAGNAQPCNWYDILSLVFTRDGHKLEDIKLRIAREYYRHREKEEN